MEDKTKTKTKEKGGGLQTEAKADKFFRRRGNLGATPFLMQYECRVSGVDIYFV